MEKDLLRNPQCRVTKTLNAMTDKLTIGASCLFAYLKTSMHRHWKLLGLALVIVIALSSSAYAYWRINASSPSLYVTATYPPLELRLELEKAEFQLEENVTVHLCLKNVDSKPVEIGFSSFCIGDTPPFRRVLRFIVKDENGTDVYMHPVIMFLAVYDFVLQPGEQRIETYEWAQTYSLDPYAGQPFKPGKYQIMGQTLNYGIRGDLLRDPILETPRITITIT